MMTKKARKKFTPEQKRQAVEEYLCGDKSAAQIAEELETEAQSIYRWKSAQEEQKKDLRIDELINEGNSYNQAKKILELELEIQEYKNKLAEQVLINDLLKKLQTPASLQPESELTGLIRTANKSARKTKRVKR